MYDHAEGADADDRQRAADGNKVRIESVDHGAMATLTWTQLLSLEDGQLVVVTTSAREGEPRWGTTFRYRKK